MNWRRWPQNSASRHFRFAQEPEIRDGNARTVCGSYVPRTCTLELREAALSDCPACQLVKDAWLEQEKRKPLTVRRCRELWATRFGGNKPIQITNAREQADAERAEAAKSPEQVREEAAAQEQAHAQRMLARAQATEAARLRDATVLLAQRERALTRLLQKQSRLESNIKRAKRRVTQARARLAKVTFPPEVTS